MGNSATKEQRLVPTRLRPDSRRGSSAATSGPNSPSSIPPQDLESHHPLYGSRSGRGSQANLSSILGIGHGIDRERDSPTIETRRESKQERDQRRLERDRVNREKERARSMRDENVDGGYVVTQGVYTGLEDFNKPIVRHLMVERRLAPFWKGLNDHSESWTEHQLVAAVRGLPIPAADAIPKDDQSSPVSPMGLGSQEIGSTQNQLTVPVSSITHRSSSESISSPSPTQPNFPFPTSSPSTNTSSSGPAMFRGRSKTLATLTSASKASQVEMMPREKQLPKDPFVNGQPIEAYLYKDASECPICFIYYPPYLNRTRCCDQNICSECFVQIKRPDPHLPEHQDPSSQEPSEPPDPDAMVSEIAKCPFCKQPDLGVTYQPPPFQRGLTYVSQASTKPLGKVASAMSSSSSLASAMSGGKASSVDTARKRAQSISANDPAVITTDRVRPDWHLKLEGARAHAARRSAAATALHTAAYIMGSRGQEPDGRGLGAFGRRGLLRRGSGPASSSAGDSSAQMNILAMMAERYGVQGGNRIGEDHEVSGPRGSSRRVRLEDLEEVMMMEAIRMSLASEEGRRKKEEEETKGSKKEAKREAKKKEKELKKAEKNAKKSGIYGSVSQSSTDLRGEKPQANVGKGKGIQQPDAETGSERVYTGASSSTQLPFATSYPFNTDGASDDPQLHLERARAQLQPEISAFASPPDTYPYRQSPLRSQSSTSSTDDDDDSVRASLGGRFPGSGSSFEVSPSGSGINVTDGGTANLSGTPPGGGAGVEPMFNFRSLAAMVGHDDEKAEMKREQHVDEAADDARHDDERSRGESSSDAITSPLAEVVDWQRHMDESGVSRSHSTRTVPDEAFHDALESTTAMAPPEVNITAPSRTGSDLVSISKAGEAKELQVPEKEMIEDTSARSMVS